MRIAFDDVHAIAYLDGHSRYESIEVMGARARSTGGSPRVRVILTLHDRGCLKGLPPPESIEPGWREIYIWQCISKEAAMQVSRWGNSLAIRIPSSVVDALELKEGDDVEVVVAGDRRIEVARDDRRARAIARMRALAKIELPPGWKFDRTEANER
jgi:antitoxin MazE